MVGALDHTLVHHGRCGPIDRDRATATRLGLRMNHYLTTKGLASLKSPAKSENGGKKESLDVRRWRTLWWKNRPLVLFVDSIFGQLFLEEDRTFLVGPLLEVDQLHETANGPNGPNTWTPREPRSTH